MHSDWDRGEFTREWDRAMKQAGLEHEVHPVSASPPSPEDEWWEAGLVVQGEATLTVFEGADWGLDEETDVDDIWIHAHFEPSDEIPSLWAEIQPWLLLAAAITLFILYWSL